MKLISSKDRAYGKVSGHNPPLSLAAKPAAASAALIAIAATALGASAATTIPVVAAVASSAASTANATTAAKVFRRGLAGVIGAFAVEGMLHLGGHGLVEEALDASQQSAVLGTAE